MFGSDICTCRPYLIYGIEEAVKEAQKGGSGGEYNQFHFTPPMSLMFEYLVFHIYLDVLDLDPQICLLSHAIFAPRFPFKTSRQLLTP